MERIPKEGIKDWFKTGDRPTEEEFSKLIDECYNIDNAATIDDIIKYVASCGFVTLDEFANLHHEITEEEANALMDEVDDEKGLWVLSINTATYDVTMNGDVNAWQTYRSKLGRYAMTNDGQARKLNRENSLLLEDGTEYDASSCHIMTRFPKLYFSVKTDGDVVNIKLAEREFINCNSFEEQWIGAYLGTVINGVLVSRADISPTGNLTINKFWEAAQANGTDWGLSNYHHRQMMMVIYLCEFLSMNSQLNLGLGMAGEGNNGCPVVYRAKTGATSILGDKCGKVDFLESGQLVAGACHVSLFGVEDPYGWFFELVQGVYFNSSLIDGQDGTECYIYEGNRLPTIEELSTTPSGIYRKIARITSPGYVMKLLWGANIDILPASIGGNSIDGHGDYYQANTTGQSPLWGGDAYNGSLCGLACALLDSSWSTSSWSFGARLAYYGSAEIV